MPLWPVTRDGEGLEVVSSLSELDTGIGTHTTNSFSGSLCVGVENLTCSLLFLSYSDTEDDCGVVTGMGVTGGDVLANVSLRILKFMGRNGGVSGA